MIAFVDPDLCIGCTQCAGLCPAVFRMEGVLAVAEPGPIPPEEVPQAVDAANAQNGGQLTLSGETANIPGGFILRNGSIEVNCAYDTLIRLQKTETAGQVARQLFG